MLSVNGSTNALDVFEFFYNNCDIEEIRLSNYLENGKEYIEENYVKDFIDYVRERKKDNKHTQISSSIKKDSKENKNLED